MFQFFTCCYTSLRQSPAGLLSSSTASYRLGIITGPPNGPVLFCWLASVTVVVCNTAAGHVETLPTVGPAGRVDGRAADTAQRASHVTSCYDDHLFHLCWLCAGISTLSLFPETESFVRISL